VNRVPWLYCLLCGKRQKRSDDMAWHFRHEHGFSVRRHVPHLGCQLGGFRRFGDFDERPSLLNTYLARVLPRRDDDAGS
jgi:hypothetical protein